MDLLKLKYIKHQKNPIKGLYKSRNNKNSKIVFGTIGLKSLENGYVSFKHLESTRRVLSRHLKKIAKIWIRINPKIPVTLKLGDKRMGKGKGDPVTEIFKVHVGMILFEIEGNNYQVIEELLKKAQKKLPVKTKVILINNSLTSGV